MYIIRSYGRIPLFLLSKVKKTVKMNKVKLKKSQIVIVICILIMSLIWTKRPVEAALVDDNIEALATGEISVKDVCKKAGGACFIDKDNWAFGISLEN